LCFPYKNIGLKVFFAKKPEFELVSPNSLKCPVARRFNQWAGGVPGGFTLLGCSPQSKFQK